MLQKIREKFTGGIALAILVLIGASFVFVGVNYDFASGAYAAKVDGEEIPAALFEQRYQQELMANPDLAQASDVQKQQARRQILDSLIREQLLLTYMIENGYRVGNDQLTSILQRETEFQTDGVFDRQKYLDFVQTRGLDPRQFEEDQRAFMREYQLRSGIMATAVVTPAEYRRFLNLAAEQRLVSLATLTQDLVNDEITVTEEQVQAFYDENPTLFQLPESADIEYVRISRVDVAADVEVSDEELADYYEDNKDRYLQPEERRARHILILFGDDEVASQAQAEDLLARIRAGESFETLAGEFSADTLTAADGGSFGARTQEQYPDVLQGPVFDMAVGDVEGPYRSDFGFHIVQLDEVLERGPLPLDQVRGELLSELRDREAESLYLDLERGLSDALFDMTDIAAIAAAVGAEVGTIKGFTRDGAEPFGSNQAAIDAVFDPMIADGQQVSDVIDLDASSAAVFRVSQYNPATRQPLDDVREQIDAYVRSQTAQGLLSARASQILAAVEAGEDFGVAAEAAGATVGEPRLLSRQQPDVDQLVVFEVFAAEKPQQDSAVRDIVRGLDGSYTVYSLQAVVPGRPESIPLAQRDAGKAQLAQDSGVNDYIAFVQALYNEADVVINEDALAEQDIFQ